MFIFINVFINVKLNVQSPQTKIELNLITRNNLNLIILFMLDLYIKKLKWYLLYFCISTKLGL